MTGRESVHKTSFKTRPAVMAELQAVRSSNSILQAVTRWDCDFCQHFLSSSLHAFDGLIHSLGEYGLADEL